MGGLAHASSATERLPCPSRFSTDGNSYGVRLENRNRRAPFTYPQVAKTARREAAWKRSLQGTTRPPMTIYGFTRVAATLASAFFSSSGLNPKGPGLLLYATWPVASIK